MYQLVLRLISAVKLLSWEYSTNICHLVLRLISAVQTVIEEKNNIIHLVIRLISIVKLLSME
jgi:hypothetical protein